MEAYLVGGAVRDEIMGVPCKDHDFTVVSPSFEAMRDSIVDAGMKIVVETPEFYTIRAVAKVPFRGYRGGLDFVWAREEGPYSDGRRPDWVKPGTLAQDLERRDLTINAIAKDADGSFIDLFGGQEDIADGLIRAVGDPVTRLTEDALRAVRAMRFAVTKGFRIDKELELAMQHPAVLDAIVNNISDERMGTPREGEISKMMRFDSLATIKIFNRYPLLTDAMFAGTVSLDSTLKTKGRGKR